MGRKVGEFASRNGHTYEVAFSGEGVADATLTLGVPPVVISMAQGERKFVGFKSTTATITIATDTPLLDLYTERVDGVAVVVTDTTSGTVEFRGYVTPFEFSQPYTGLDTVTVSAVDALTARKDVRYNNVGSVHGVDAKAIDIVKAIVVRAGLSRVVIHANFSGVTFRGDDPLNVMVAQAGFLQDEVSDCDALSAICQFFGYTACAIGDTLYLYDEHCMLYADEAHRELAIGYTYYPAQGAWGSEGILTEAANPVRWQSISDTHNDVTVTMERAYDGVQITPEGSDVSVLLPDVCADANMSELDGVEKLTTATEEGVEYRTARDSHVMQLGSNGLVPTEPEYVADDNWNGAAILMHVDRVKREEVTFGASSTKYTVWTSEGGGNFIRIRPLTGVLNNSILVGRQDAGCAYSHTGGLVKLTMKFRMLALENWQDTSKTLEVSDASTASLGLIAVNCGDKRLRYDFTPSALYNTWEAGYNGATILAIKGYELFPTATSQSMLTREVLIAPPSSGAISVDIAFANQPYGTQQYEYLIESLSLEGYGEPIDLECGDMRYTFKGNKRELLEASTMLTTRKNGVESLDKVRVNARPGVVTDANWVGGYMGRSDSEAIPLAGVLMEQLKTRYAKPRAAYRMTATKYVRPYAPVRWMEKTYTVDAYDWDVEADAMTVTID